ncbi:glycosyltransferase [Zeaxanthinibacter sp. PT1]|uniref:glycosyltransferase n=1 Tax=Zeaxanthinibacter TaxID=561554 RepID=UPI00234B3965|nr:glycosyltransferase [Zeaxanthinibacter sp. PT1]MDC6352769.1 glycosyltransferase [Zeaxanthinibacter sp. PT1]
MRLSIVIPCYNMERYLPTCLDSILRQELGKGDFEVIIVNDESKDDTLKIARKYEEIHEEITVIDKVNAGVGAARNSGLDVARGTYVYFLDPDDYLANNMLPGVLDLAESNDLDILTFDSLSVGSDEIIQDSKFKSDGLSTDICDGISFIALRKFSNEIWWYLIRREFMLSKGLRFIEGRWMEDAILTAQLFRNAHRIAHTNSDVHRYRILPTSAMRNKSREHYNKVIYDNANAAHAFVELLCSIPPDHPKSEACKIRLRTRQQSFVFFLLVRLMKSDISTDKIPEMLQDFEKIGAYPLNAFLGQDYHGIRYSILVTAYNKRYMIRPFIKIYRTYDRIFNTNSIQY